MGWLMLVGFLSYYFGNKFSYFCYNCGKGCYYLMLILLEVTLLSVFGDKRLGNDGVESGVFIYIQ
jgi:hypothetical protein